MKSMADSDWLFKEIEGKFDRTLILSMSSKLIY